MREWLQHWWKEEREGRKENRLVVWGTGLCTQFVLHSLSAIGLCWLHPAEGLLHMRLSHIRGMALGVAVFSAPGLLLGLSLSLLAWQFGACLSFV